MKFPTRVFAAVLIAAFGLCAVAQAQVLNQVPSTAMAVLKVNSLSAVNAKAIKLANTFGLDELVPDFKDPLASVLDKSHMGAGFNKDGELAVAIFPPPGAGKAGAAPQPDQDPGAIVLVPVSDYQAFVGNFKNAKADGDITSANAPDDNKPLFLAHWGDYAAVTPNRALLDLKPDGFKLHGLAVQEAQSQDFTLIANMEQMRKVVLPQLADARAKLLDQLTKDVPPDEQSQKLVPILRIFVNIYMDEVQSFIEQGTNGVMSMNLSDDGISAGGLAEFKAGSPIGANLAKLKGNSTGSLLAGLPDRKYFAYGGYAADPKVASQMLGDVTDPIVKELATAGDEWKPAVDLLGEFKDFVGATQSTASGYVVPTGAIGQESILQTVAVTTGDSKAIQADNRKMLASLTDFLKNGPKLPTGAPMNIDFKPDAKTVDGVSFDHMQTNVVMNPNDPAAAQTQQAMAMIYGPAGASADFGAVSDSKFVAVGSGTDQLLSDVITSAKAGDDHLGGQANVAQVAAHLPKNPVLVYYIALDNIASTGARYAATFGIPLKFQLPPNLPPIGFGVGADGSSVRGEMFIPAELVQNLISAGLQARQNIQGAPGAGAGPN